MHWKYHLNKWLYIMSSALYLLGSALLHSYFSKNKILATVSTLSFIFASILFFLAAFQLLLTNFQTLLSKEELLLTNKMEKFNTDTAISFCVLTMVNISGILFTIGSVAFWPTLDHCNQILGIWMFRCGASLVVIGNAWLLIRMQMKKMKCSIDKLTTLMVLLGAVGFIVGGAFLQAGSDHVDHGSFSLMAGSYLLLLSSILSYKL